MTNLLTGETLDIFSKTFRTPLKTNKKTTRDIMFSDSFVRIYCHIGQQKKRTERHIF